MLVHEYVFASHSDYVLRFFHEAVNRVSTLDVLDDFWERRLTFKNEIRRLVNSKLMLLLLIANFLQMRNA